VLALAVLRVGFALAMSRWGSSLNEVLGAGSLSFLPAGLSVLVIVGGMAVGALGGLAASRNAV